MSYIIGLDETGYGCGVGNLYVCAVKSTPNWSMEGLKDSKKLSKEERKILGTQLRNCNDIEYLILSASNEEIDQNGLGATHKTLMASLIDNFWTVDAEIIIDGNINPKLYQEKSQKQDDWKNVNSIIKADDKYPQVMAASILAKYAKDLEIEEKDREYPQYGWKTNSGYLGKEHKEAIKKYGLTEFHRKSYNIKGI